MNWTKTEPTQAGEWKWRAGKGGGEYAGNLVKTEQGLFFAFYLGFKPVTELGGEWLLLYGGDVLAAEVEKGYKEGWYDRGKLTGGLPVAFGLERVSKKSRAYRITTGETEPSL